MLRATKTTQKLSERVSELFSELKKFQEASGLVVALFANEEDEGRPLRDLVKEVPTCIEGYIRNEMNWDF